MRKLIELFLGSTAVEVFELPKNPAGLQLTTKKLQKFVGGDLEIHTKERRIYRGRIKSASAHGQVLTVRMKWVAKLDTGGCWVLDKNGPYTVELQVIEVVQDYGEGRLMIAAPVFNEVAVFFARGGSRLEESSVAGLGKGKAREKKRGKGTPRCTAGCKPCRKRRCNGSGGEM